jgi:hypothetical protein
MVGSYGGRQLFEERSSSFMGGGGQLLDWREDMIKRQSRII